MEGINNTTLLIQIIIGGVFVLSSYAWAFSKNNAMDLWGGVRWPCVQWSWAVSGVTTAFAFLYTSGTLLFDESVVGEVNFTALNIYFGMILLPAALWAYITFGVIAGRVHVLILFFDLMLVAVGSMGILLEVAPLDRTELNAAAAMMIFQHLFLDHILWFILFTQSREERYRERLQNARDASELI